MSLVTIEQYESMSVEKIQELHVNEIKLINEVDQLVKLCVEGNADLKDLDKKLEEYVEHVKEHFRYEEELMQEYNFPSYDMHKLAHDMFLADMGYATMIWKQRNDPNKLVKFIRKSPEWIESHMSSVDASTADYISKKQSQSLVK